jgi:hypothetical protein
MLATIQFRTFCLPVCFVWVRNSVSDIKGGTGCRGEYSYKFLCRKPGEKRSLENPRHRWGYSKMDLNEIECDGMDWLRDRDKWRDLVSTVEGGHFWTS